MAEWPKALHLKEKISSVRDPGELKIILLDLYRRHTVKDAASVFY